MDQFLSINDVCDLLKLSRWTVAKLIETGELKASKIAGSYRVKRSDIDNMVNNSVVK